MHRFARETYDLRVRYIGGCCGFEPYPVQPVAEELETEWGTGAAGSKKQRELVGASSVWLVPCLSSVYYAVGVTYFAEALCCSFDEASAKGRQLK
jgi:hypothetical protein